MYTIVWISGKHRKKIIKWLQKKGLLCKAPSCRRCGKNMRITTHSGRDGYIWTCRRNTHRRITLSIRNGSLFNNSRVPLVKWMEYIYRFSQGLHLRQIDLMEDCVAKTSTTLSRMNKLLRKVCINALSKLKRKTGLRVGGKSRQKFVAIDESKFAHKRKFNRGRCRTTWQRKKGWVFGMMEVKGARRLPVLKMVKDRSRTTLMPIIKRHIRRGSAVYSDNWRAYLNALQPQGYKHLTVNHSKNFIDPQTGCHTQHIERAWLTIKAQVSRFRGNKTKKLLKEHLKFIQWHYCLGRRNRKGALAQLIHDIRKAYRFRFN
ncbi:uncharacterized protein LOC143757139 [Siphateles boraxobius]|uniref:uncharacterized protein LOC143757139 n=1 Tax=Siphateles boraxobius TaxID=180520 RepID=UPI004062CF95